MKENITISLSKGKIKKEENPHLLKDCPTEFNNITGKNASNFFFI
jgi:hypothetical protein